MHCVRFFQYRKTGKWMCSASYISRQWYTHTCNDPLSRTTRVSRYQKGKTNLDFTEARDSGISWAICKPESSLQTTTPAPHNSRSFTGRMPFLPPNQKRQSTKGIATLRVVTAKPIRKQKTKQEKMHYNSTRNETVRTTGFGSIAQWHRLFLTCIVVTESNHKYKTIRRKRAYSPADATATHFSKIQKTFLVPAHPGSHGKKAVKHVLWFPWFLRT